MSDENSDDSLVCLPKAELDMLLHRSNLSSSLWGGFWGFVGTVIATVVAALATAWIASGSTAEMQAASRFQSGFESFQAAIGGNAGWETDLSKIAKNQKQKAINIAVALTSNKPDSALSYLGGSGPDDGYSAIKDDYEHTLVRIEGEVGQAATDFAPSQDSQQSNPFHVDRLLLARVAESNVACLTALSQSYQPPQNPHASDVRCPANYGSTRYQSLRDRLALLDDCERAVSEYLKSLSKQLSARADAKAELASPYSPTSLWKTLLRKVGALPPASAPP